MPQLTDMTLDQLIERLQALKESRAGGGGLAVSRWTAGWGIVTTITPDVTYRLRQDHPLYRTSYWHSQSMPESDRGEAVIRLS